MGPDAPTAEPAPSSDPFSPGALWHRGKDLAIRHRIDLLVIVGLTLIGAIARLFDLTDLPAGLHGDEAWTGLEARRLLDHGPIGPYSTSALGQPSGPIYFAASFVAILGNTVLAVRLPMALLGVITIPVAYLTFRVMFDKTTATFAGLLLALAGWHLYYSRLGFMVISWPLFELLSVLFLFLGFRDNHRAWFVLSGVCLGAGVYTYNAYLGFLVPFALLLGWLCVFQAAPGRMALACNVGILCAVGLVVALPLIVYAIDPRHDYLSHHQRLSLTQSEQWDERTLQERVDLVLDRSRDFFARAFWGGSLDASDGAGRAAMVDHVSLGLMAIGLVMLVGGWRNPSNVAVLLMVAVLPLGAVLTYDETSPIYGIYRRALGLAPFLAVLAALPLAWSWHRASRLSEGWRALSYGMIIAAVAAIGYINVDDYFVEFRDDALAQEPFGEPLVKASYYVEDFPGDPYVLFYTDRGTFDYETRRYLAPHREGENRSFTDPPDLEPRWPGDVVYVFMPNQADLLNQVVRLYPGGVAYRSISDDGSVEFAAYYLPATARSGVESKEAGVCARPEAYVRRRIPVLSPPVCQTERTPPAPRENRQRDLGGKQDGLVNADPAGASLLLVSNSSRTTNTPLGASTPIFTREPLIATTVT